MFKYCLAIILFFTGSALALAPLPPLDQPWTTEDLKPIDRLIGGSTLVGLGESTHATESFSKAKARLIRHMVENLGFRALAMETPWLAAEKVNAYVLRCAGRADEALGQLWPVWRSRSVRDLLAWMCSYNRRHPGDPARFYGFDTQNPSPDVYKAIVRKRPKSARALTSCFGALSDDFAALVRDAGAGKVSIGDSEHEACLRELASLERSRPGVDLMRDIISLRANQLEFYYLHRDPPRAAEARDVGMALTLELLNLSQRTIVWAHNDHLAMDHAVIDGVGTMGRQISLVHQDYFPIALTGFEVDFHWPGHDVEALPDPGPDAIERVLSEAGTVSAIVDPPSTACELGGEKMVPNSQFRAVLFLERVEPMESVD